MSCSNPQQIPCVCSSKSSTPQCAPFFKAFHQLLIKTLEGQDDVDLQQYVKSAPLPTSPNSCQCQCVRERQEAILIGPFTLKVACMLSCCLFGCSWACNCKNSQLQLFDLCCNCHLSLWLKLKKDKNNWNDGFTIYNFSGVWWTWNETASVKMKYF